MALAYDFGSARFDEAVRAAGHQAFLDTLAAGLPVFHPDDDGIDSMLLPDGRKYVIRWIPAPSGENYETVREVTVHAA